jgi:hypothetical protein
MLDDSRSRGSFRYQKFWTFGKMIGVRRVRAASCSANYGPSLAANSDPTQGSTPSDYQPVKPSSSPPQHASLVAVLFCSARLASFSRSPGTGLNPGPTPDLHPSFLPASKLLPKSGPHWAGLAATCASSCDRTPSGKLVSLTDALLIPLPWTSLHAALFHCRRKIADRFRGTDELIVKIFPLQPTHVTPLMQL